MKSFFKLLFPAALVFFPLICAAQYSFTPTLQGAGSKQCSQVANEVNRQVLGFTVSGIPTKSECIQIRNTIQAIKVSSYGCNIYYTCTPCVGTDINSNSGLEALASTQPDLNQGVGTRNYIDDYEYKRYVQYMKNRLELLISNGNMEYNTSLNDILANDISRPESNISYRLKKWIPNIENEINSTVDNIYSTLNSKYADDFGLFILLEHYFSELTGFELGSILSKDEWTFEEYEILNRYKEFCGHVITRLQQKYANDSEYDYKPLEMALYAMHIYDDTPARQYDEWCRPLTDVSRIKNADERNSAAKILEFLKATNNKNDFQADFYYDEDKDSYVLAFRGTETNIKNLLKDWRVDGTYLVTGASPQHDYAAALGEIIANSGLPIEKLTITGHSLGGGLALVTGMKSGAETYVYDPLHLTEKAAMVYDLDLSRQSNIYCFEEKDEGLVSVGEVSVNGISKGITLLSEAHKSAAYDDMGMNYNMQLANLSLHDPILVGEQSVVKIPGKDFKLPGVYFATIPGGPLVAKVIERVVNGKAGASTYFNHSIIDMVSGIAASAPENASKFFHGRNNRTELSKAKKALAFNRYGDIGKNIGVKFETLKRPK